MIPERPVSFGLGTGPVLEGALAIPAGASAGVVVAHPHPLYGGDMDSAVVMSAVQACSRANLATLRFNFRGVGGSTGAWDEGRGEQDDVRTAVSHLRSLLGPTARAALAGYSFGAAMVAAVAASGEPLAGLALIAPPLAMRGLPPAPPAVDGPVHVVAGRADTYCPADALAALARSWPAATVTVIDGADHFFFGGLDALAAALAGWTAKLST
jgi:alpha/beta superfamily hydrolase